MTETEEEPVQHLSIQARIAALKLDQVRKNPSPKQGPPPLPLKPPANRTASAAVLPTIGSDIGNEPNGDVLPSLPRRKGQPSPLPLLPPRRPSEVSKKSSQESISSVISSVSALSNGTYRSSIDNGRIRAPVYDVSILPPLLPSRRAQEEQTDVQSNGIRPTHRLGSSKSTANVSTRELPAPRSPNLPALPQRPRDLTSPALPSRPNSSSTPALNARSDIPALPQRQPSNEPPLPRRRLPPTTIPHVNPRTPSIPRRPDIQTDNLSVPPPIPANTRPNLNKLLATKPKIAASNPPQAFTSAISSEPNGTTSSNDCLLCRDFSGPDNHAAKFPRQDVPYMSWLAEQLTAPFPSHTDKARAIFAWLHYNIDYDVVAFFNNNIQPSTPAGTIESGKAVCEGYAALFAALATTAGMEAIVVVGHGKGKPILQETRLPYLHEPPPQGFGYQPLKPGERCPPKDFNHAWNAVKIDNGAWRLLDSCWGAGNVCTNKYTRHFTPQEFTKSNEDFCLKHFPSNPKHFFRADNRTPSWEEYYLGSTSTEPVFVFSDFSDEGFSPSSLVPAQLHISPHSSGGPTTRFQFQRLCPHWDPIRNGAGKAYVYILSIGSGDPEPIPFENDGHFWWVDVPISKLGREGDEIVLCAVDTVSGVSARGMSKSEWVGARGRKGMSWKYCARWVVGGG